MAGVEALIRTLYPDPATVPARIAPVMLPLVIEVRVPRLTGEVKEPLASESCAVNTLPVVNPEAVKLTERFVPAQA